MVEIMEIFKQKKIIKASSDLYEDKKHQKQNQRETWKELNKN